MPHILPLHILVFVRGLCSKQPHSPHTLLWGAQTTTEGASAQVGEGPHTGIKWDEFGAKRALLNWTVKPSISNRPNILRYYCIKGGRASIHAAQ